MMVWNTCKKKSHILLFLSICLCRICCTQINKNIWWNLSKSACLCCCKHFYFTWFSAKKEEKSLCPCVQININQTQGSGLQTTNWLTDDKTVQRQTLPVWAVNSHLFCICIYIYATAFAHHTDFIQHWVAWTHHFPLCSIILCTYCLYCINHLWLSPLFTEGLLGFIIT